MPPRIKTANIYKIAGELRRSQTITTFGCGAIVDLPRFSGIMAGIDNWEIQKLPEGKIREKNLEKMLGKEHFYQASSPETNTETTFGLQAYRFPTWYYCPVCHKLDYYKKIARPVTSNTGKYNSDLVCNTCSTPRGKVKLIPSRFVVACLNGHIEDFPYIWWVHRKKGRCERPQLLLEYKGTTGGLDSIKITCETCGAGTTMSGCMGKDALKNLKCKGNMPWLGFAADGGGWYKDSEDCNAQLRVLQRSANNVYYPVNQSALTIPPWSKKIQLIFEAHDSLFEDIFDEGEETDILKRLKSHFKKNPERYECDEETFITEAYRRYKDTGDEANPETFPKMLRLDEYRALSGEDVNEIHFHTLTVDVPDEFSNIISKIKLVKRLREVMVLRGFRRILPEQETDKEKRKKQGISNSGFSPISKQPKHWLPAIELFGEGIFIDLNETAVQEWERRNIERYSLMAKRHDRSWIGNEMFNAKFPRFVLLHTLSHFLIRQLSAQSGYATASIREKIFSTFPDLDSRMCGILLYTSATDTDGSLGGLVREGHTDKMEVTLKNMLREGSWCSNDPICIDTLNQGYGGLNYAACHACALLPETSCEALNCLLDRAAIIGTPGNPDIAFFRDFLWGGNNG